MQTFQGSHIHAPSNTVFHYAGDFDARGEDVSWSATLSLDGRTVDTLKGTTGYGLPSVEAIHAVLKELHARIDAWDFGPAPLRPADRRA